MAELDEGRDVVLEIDVQGARTVRDRVPDAVLLFLSPPSPHELERRLRARRSENEAQLSRRLAAAALGAGESRGGAGGVAQWGGRHW